MAAYPTGSQAKNEFFQLAATVFGEPWQKRLATHLGVDPKDVGSWADPREARYPPQGVVAFLREQALAILQTNGGRKAAPSNLHPNVASGLTIDFATPKPICHLQEA